MISINRLSLVLIALVFSLTEVASAQVPFIPGLSGNGHLLLSLSRRNGGSNSGGYENTQSYPGELLPRISKLGRCAVIAREGRDYANFSCTDKTKYGVVYDGYLISSSPCYATADEADQVMRSLGYCDIKPKLNDCRVLFPGDRDYGGNKCGEGRFAVTIKGYLLENVCYADVLDALKLIFNSPLCTEGKKPRVDLPASLK